MPKDTFNSCSSSSESDDEETKRLSQAIDPDFMKISSSNGHQSKQECQSADDTEKPVSKRPKLTMDDVEYSKPYSLDITPDSQKFIAKKLTKSLEKSLKEISPPPPQQLSLMSFDTGIKLFSTSQDTISEKDLVEKKVKRPKPQKRKKKKRKKDTTASAESDSSSDSDTEKLRSVAVTADWVLNRE